MSPSFLCKVLKGSNDLSLEKSIIVTKQLGYSEDEAQQFCFLVQADAAKSPGIKKLHRKVLNESTPLSQFSTISLETFQAVSDWHHYGILYLVSCRGFQPKPAYIAERLGISLEQAQDALARLLKLGLIIKKESRLVRAKDSIATPTDRPSRAIRHFHSQMIEKAKEALEFQPVSKRDITGMTMSISEDKIDLAKEEIRKFRRKLAKLLETDEPTEVYQLNVQFFSLSKKKQESL